MKAMPPSHAEQELDQLANRFAHWRQCRATPRQRIPKALWDQAVSLTHVLPLSRVAKRLGLCTNDLKKRCGVKRDALGAEVLPATLSFVEVTASSAWLPPSAEVELRRADGVGMRIAFRESKPALAPLVKAFLEAR